MVLWYNAKEDYACCGICICICVKYAQSGPRACGALVVVSVNAIIVSRAKLQRLS